MQKRGVIFWFMIRSAISGSNGFLGSHLVEALEMRGDRVLRIDRALFASPDALKDTLTDFKPDEIFHLAAYGNHSNQNDIDMILSASVFNLYLLLRQTRDIPYKAFVNVSTSSVNLRKQTFYSATKAAGEKIANAFRETYEKPIVTVRPASIYGPGEAEHRFIPTIIRSLKEDAKMDLVPFATHSWMYVEDFVRAIVLIASKAYDIREPLNISDNETYSNEDVVKKLERISKKTLRYQKVPSMRDYDTNEWIVGNATLRGMGFKSHNTLEEGLKKTYDSF